MLRRAVRRARTRALLRTLATVGAELLDALRDDGSIDTTEARRIAEMLFDGALAIGRAPPP